MDAVRTTLSSLGQDRLAASQLGRNRNAAEESGDARQASGVDFGRQLLGTVADADRLITQAETQATALANDKADAVETIIAVSKADLALRHVVTLRNRALEAYQEIMRMPI